MNEKKLIEIKNLKTYFYTEAGTAKAVDNISFDIYKEGSIYTSTSLNYNEYYFRIFIKNLIIEVL